ncbi:MAG: MnmA/TRMU family protein, partial [Lachnospiraceae bacterium]
MSKALIAMSGGVDSSVAAYMMKEQGYSCIGVTMKLFGNEEIGLSREHTCCSLDDVEDARNVARLLHIPYYVFNFSERFRECVTDKFVRAYETGFTPNPCIDCNRYLKFDLLYRRAKELGCDYVVTGHYARVEYDAVPERYLLKKALDPDKDQSYVLYTMTQEQLRHTLFPLGELTKPEVRN